MKKTVGSVALAAVLFAGCAHVTPREAEATRGYRLSEVDVRPRLLSCPGQAPMLGVKSFVGMTVAFSLDEHGVPQNVAAAGSRNSAAAYAPKGEQIVRSCRFSPAMRNGEAVAVRGMTTSVRLSVSEALGKPKIAAPLPADVLDHPIR